MSNGESQRRRRTSHNIVAIVIIIALIGGAIGGYWWRAKEAKNEKKTQADQVSQLQQQLSSVQKDLTTEKEKSSSSSNTSTASSGPSQSTIDNVNAAITSGNTQALEGYMAPKVLVAIAASDGIGIKTPSDATAAVTNFLKGTTSPWDFSLPTGTINTWGSGDYAQYFPVKSVVGKSANNHVISFGFNNAGKIITVFMAASSDLL